MMRKLSHDGKKPHVTNIRAIVANVRCTRLLAAHYPVLDVCLSRPYCVLEPLMFACTKVHEQRM